MKVSVLTDMIDALRAQNIEAWLPGKHDGKCKGPYTVVADDGIRRMGRTTGRHFYTVTAFVPAKKPTAMAELLAGVRTAMAGLDNLKEEESQSGDMIDDEIEAYIVEARYSALCSMI